METDPTYDCIVIGAGIAGLGAALKLNDAGLKVLVLESSDRVGGRMTTDRIAGFSIDRGVTILGNDFKNINALVKRFALQKHVCPINFSFGLVEPAKTMRVRTKRLDDLLFNRDLAFKTKLAAARLGMDVLLRRKRLLHGISDKAGDLDDSTVQQYLESINGSEFLDRILFPGLATAFGGPIEKSSKLILWQTFRNIFLTGSWTLDTGVDLIPETMAKNLPLKLSCPVASVTYGNKAVDVKTKSGESYSGKTVIIAIPGNHVPALCPQLPDPAKQTLQQTAYGKITNVHLGIDKIIPEKFAFMSASKYYNTNYVLELERNRCKGLCPEGKDMASIFWWDDTDRKPSTMSNAQMESEAERVMAVCIPSSTKKVLFRHHVKWNEGIAFFAPGRIREVSALRNEMKTWKIPVQLCGDYLDGLSCEGALKTGLQAGENIISYLNNQKQHGI